MAVRTRIRLGVDARRASIVSAAMACFARGGFSGTSSRALARAAGISEALMFRHFPTKRSLYRAIVGRKMEEPSGDLFPEAASAREDDRAVLGAVADALIRRVERDPSFLRLLLFSALENEPLGRMFFRSRGLPVRAFLAGYFRRRIRGGAFRAVHPEAAAAAFVGMVFHHLLCRHIFHVRVPRLSRKRLVATCVDLFLRGIVR